MFHLQRRFFSVGIRQVHRECPGFRTKREFDLYLDEQSVLPKGFQAGVANLQFFPQELGKRNVKPQNMKISVIKPETPVPSKNYAAKFTQNIFKSAPVRIGLDIVKNEKQIGAILINNKVANVHPQGGGELDAREVCEELQRELGLPQNKEIFPSSTGVIGWRLPVEQMKAALHKAALHLSKGSISEVAKAIMTTDSYPKARTLVIEDTSNNMELARITGIAKGAGMIEPNMATMLVYILTDAEVCCNLNQCLEDSINAPGSFNCISVDSDQSTSDTILLMSSGMVEKPKEISEEEWSRCLSQAITRICQELAHDVVRNGEGVNHVIRAIIKGAPELKVAHGMGKSIVNSPLVKTAVAGNDPNVGRILMAIGNAPGVSSELVKQIDIYVGETLVFSNGEFTLDGQKEAELAQYFRVCEQHHHDFPQNYNTVDITVDLGVAGGYETVILGADLSGEYVKVNAGYRS